MFQVSIKIYWDRINQKEYEFIFYKKKFQQKLSIFVKLVKKIEISRNIQSFKFILMKT